MPYANTEALILETLLELVAQGRLTGTDIRFDNEPLEIQEDVYRPDGWSIETTDGCRSHRLVDEAIDAFKASSDPYEREAAATFPHLFTMNQTRYPSVAAEDQDQRDLAIAARNRWFSIKWLLNARTPVAMMPFTTRDGYSNDDAAVILGRGQPDLPEIAPAAIVGFLQQAADNLRTLANRDPNDGNP